MAQERVKLPTCYPQRFSSTSTLAKPRPLQGRNRARSPGRAVSRCAIASLSSRVPQAQAPGTALAPAPARTHREAPLADAAHREAVVAGVHGSSQHLVQVHVGSSAHAQGRQRCLLCLRGRDRGRRGQQPPGGRRIPSPRPEEEGGPALAHLSRPPRPRRSAAPAPRREARCQHASPRFPGELCVPGPAQWRRQHAPRRHARPALAGTAVHHPYCPRSLAPRRVPSAHISRDFSSRKRAPLDHSLFTTIHVSRKR